jgi:DNA-binding transcriptional ArsR family regulator
MTYTAAAVEWAMKVQELVLRALSGELTWIQVADILGLSARTVRRWRLRYQQYGYDGLPLTFSYTLVKTALQGAGLVAKRRPRGRPRRRREPRPALAMSASLPDGQPSRPCIMHM